MAQHPSSELQPGQDTCAQEDAVLLRRFVEEKSEAAFNALVRRHINLVYSVALRQVAGDSHLAEDVVQQVFTALARKASTLVGRPALSGWLYRSAHFAASDLVRIERRRRKREQEARVMEEISVSNEAAVDWSRMRPALDAVIAELDESDRDAVALRFFDQCSFAEVGARLRLSENAARMRVQRALDKLHAGLMRRGMRSTGAALALALGGQAAQAAPASLAAASVGAAFAGAIVGGAASGTIATIGAFMSISKMTAVVGITFAVAGGGIAFVEHQRAAVAQTAIVAATHAQEEAQARADALKAQLAEVEGRAAEADRDNRELLTAVERLKAEQTRRVAQTAVAEQPQPAPERQPQQGSIIGMVNSNGDPAQLARERQFQQELARRRADEARERARLQETALERDGGPPRLNFLKALGVVEQLFAAGDIQGATRALNDALGAKPADTPLPEHARELQEKLAAQLAEIDVPFASDGQTFVSVIGPSRLTPRQFEKISIKLLPGVYQVTGRRRGYREVVVDLQVRAGERIAEVRVACTEPLQ